jgi:acylphosphatase
MTEKETFRLHAMIEGRVQGVGFRYFTMEAAQGYGLTGWVRNRWNGKVEVIAEGTHERLNRLLSDLRRGPIGADVAKVDYSFSDPKGNSDRFTVRMTA